jgi:hypothetical protein
VVVRPELFCGKLPLAVVGRGRWEWKRRGELRGGASVMARAVRPKCAMGSTEREAQQPGN